MEATVTLVNQWQLAEMFEPGVVDRVADFLAGSPAAAGPWSWASRPGASHCRWRAAS